MSIRILDFKREKQDESLFVSYLKDPVFIISILDEDNKTKEVIIKLKGEFPFQTPIEFSFYDEMIYRNYLILEEFLLSEEGQEFINRTYLDKDKLILGLYKVLVMKYSFFSKFKKKLLIILKYLKYYSRKWSI